MASLSMLFITALVVALVALAHGYESGVPYSVHCRPSALRTAAGFSQSCELVKGKVPHPSSHAYGTFKDEVMKDGWGKIWVHGDQTVQGWYQGGFLEGALTSKRIYQHYVSWYSYQFPDSAPLTKETIKFLEDQLVFAKRLAEKPAEDPAEQEYRLTLKKLLAQFQGLVDGQNAGAESEEEKLSLVDMLVLEAAGDLYDILPAVNPATHFKLKIGQLSAQDFDDEWHKTVSCSAIIKIADDKSDVFAGHGSWTTYQSMLRIYKHYDLDGGRYQSSHSSKPGLIYSKDDFYVLPRNKLVVIETTNGVMNDELFKLVNPHTLLIWQRLPIVNTLASNGKDWVKIVSKYNSGTYANQWMVVDMKLFTPGQGVTSDKDFLWIVELAPGIEAANDVTQVMLVDNKGYWPSYNVPYDKKVYVASGFQKAYETYGDKYSYEKCPRAQIFARNHTEATTFEKVQKLLRYNDFQNDPLSLGEPSNAISSRYDLRATSPKTYGGVDAKLTSYSRIANANGRNLGPTHDQQPPFQWSTSGFNDQLHLGMPDKFDFDFAEMNFYEA